METYQLPTGETRTTCGAHRRDGLALVDGQWVCRGCGQPERIHETSAETVARNAASPALT